MNDNYYKSMNKTTILSNPSNYAWNYILHYIQFSQEEIISVKEWIELPELIKYQTSVTIQFLREHFQNEINVHSDIDWTDVKKYVTQ